MLKIKSKQLYRVKITIEKFILDMVFAKQMRAMPERRRDFL